MTQNVPNDKEERLKFLKNINDKRNFEQNINVKVQQRKLDKHSLYVRSLQDTQQLPFIEIPLVKHSDEYGEIIFRIDRENETIQTFKRTYQWDSDKDSIDDE